MGLVGRDVVTTGFNTVLWGPLAGMDKGAGPVDNSYYFTANGETGYLPLVCVHGPCKVRTFVDRSLTIVLVTVQEVPVCKLLTADLKEMDYLATGQSPSTKPVGLPFKRRK